MSARGAGHESRQSGDGHRRRAGAAARAAGRARRCVRAIALAPLLAYSRLLSPALPRRCRYEPTCSAYAIDAVRSFGLLRGLLLGGWRLLRCNPFSDGGYDPVEAQRLFRRGNRHVHT